MAKQLGLHAYEDRYRRVFEAGALHWNDPDPNPHLADLLDRVPVGTRCIEFGCGEGFRWRHMASRGLVVTGVELSATAIAKAIRETPAALAVRFLVGDVTDAASPGLPVSGFGLAVNIGCLHMMAEQEDRDAHLRLVRDLLVPGGLFFLQNGLDLDDVSAASDEERDHVARLRALRSTPSGHPIENTIRTASGDRKVMLPLCPDCRMLSLDAYRAELLAHGFRVVSSQRTGGANCPYEAVIVATRE